MRDAGARFRDGASHNRARSHGPRGSSRRLKIYLTTSYAERKAGTIFALSGGDSARPVECSSPLRPSKNPCRGSLPLDIVRKPPRKTKKYVLAGVGMAAVLLLTFFIKNLEPAPPSVER